MHQEDVRFDREVDARGLVFLLPIWKTEIVLAHMAIGQVLKVIASGCCGMVKNIQSFADQTGNVLLSKVETNGHYIFYVQKGNV